MRDHIALILSLALDPAFEGTPSQKTYSYEYGAAGTCCT